MYLQAILPEMTSITYIILPFVVSVLLTAKANGKREQQQQQRNIERNENIKFILCKINTHLLVAGIENEPTNDYPRMQ